MKKISKEIKIGSSVIVTSFLLIGMFFVSSSKSIFLKERKKTELSAAQACEFVSIVTGECVKKAIDQTPALVSVMIENHPASRPQAGLAEADIVYEVMVEGNYTRFLAIYPYDRLVAKVGPVRSSRPYYLDWLAEYDNPLYLHVGGSPEALARIIKRDIWDANEMHGSPAFWRAGNRLAPHNTYTNTEHWQKIIGNNTINTFIGWDFATSTSAECVTACVGFVEIPYLRPDFVTGWKYSTSTKQYERWQGNGPHETETGTIKADTIAIMEVPYTVLDEVGRLGMNTIGTGAAVVVIDGRKMQGSWQKSAPTERTNFYDQSGKEILFKPGKIWVQVVPRLSAVRYTEL